MDADRPCDAARPIVEKREKFIADLELPITSADPSVCDVYDANVFWTDVEAGPAGQKHQMLVGPLGDEWTGKEVHFAIQSLNVVSPVDIGRSALSNSASVKLSADKLADGDKFAAEWKHLRDAGAKFAVAVVPAVSEVSCQSPKLLYAVLNVRVKPEPMTVELTRLTDGKPIATGKVECETTSGRLLSISTDGVELGTDYVLTVGNLSSAAPGGPAGAQSKIVFRVDHIGPDRWSAARKISFGPPGVSLGDYECVRYWDGNYGFTYPMWQWGSTSGKTDPAAGLEENLKKVHTSLHTAKFGEVVFRMRLNPFVTQYRVVAMGGDAAWPPHNMSLAFNGKPIWDKVDTWHPKRFAKADETLDIPGGELRVAFDFLNYIEVYPQYKWQEVKTGR